MFGFKTRRQLLRENKAMREALLWYAAAETWRRKGIHPKGSPRKRWRKSPAAFDRGHMAIRVLTEIDESRGNKTFAFPVPRFVAPTTQE